MYIRRNLNQAAIYLILILLVFLTFYPFILTVQTSLKDNPQFYHSFWVPTLPLHFENYVAAFQQIAHYMINSLIVSGVSALGVMICAALAAFAFARLRLAGRELLYYLVISLMMVPPVLTLIPTFILVKNMGLADNLLGLILPYTASGQVIAIFIMRGFFAGLPQEIFDAALVDGASDWQIFWNIGLPLIRPVLATIAILETLVTWNDYVWPAVVLTNDQLRTLTLGLVFFQSRHVTYWGPLMAGYVIASLPLLILFLFTMRYFIEGLTTGALKA
jgi:raffinose/stachyose/melibiose transport system permease protein